MKTFLPALIATLLALLLWWESDFESFSRDKYLSEKVLELSYPINVKIDLELLEQLGPAYEQ